VGTVLDTVAITTVSPADSPDWISVRDESAAPVVTTTDEGTPLVSTCTVEVVPLVWTALLGTVSTPTTWLMITLMVADIPSRSEGCVPVTCTVTGKVATPDATVAI